MQCRAFVNLIFVFLLASSFAQPKTTVSGKAESALQNLIKQMVEAQAAYTPSALDKLLAPDYIEISPLDEVDLRNKVLEFYKSADNPANLQVTVEADELKIPADNNFAVVRAHAPITRHWVVNLCRVAARHLWLLSAKRHMESSLGTIRYHSPGAVTCQTNVVYE